MNLDTRKYLEPLEKPNNPIASDWWIHRATPTTGDYVWRCVHVHKLSDAENEGAHNVYIDLLDINGKRIDSITDSIVIRYGWEGMRPEEAPKGLTIDKPSPEPGTNFALFKGMIASCWCESGTLQAYTDGAWNLDAEDGHTSYYVIFQHQLFKYGEVTAPHQPEMVTVPVSLINDIKAKSAALQEAIARLP